MSDCYKVAIFHMAHFPLPSILFSKRKGNKHGSRAESFVAVTFNFFHHRMWHRSLVCLRSLIIPTWFSILDSSMMISCVVILLQVNRVSEGNKHKCCSNESAKWVWSALDAVTSSKGQHWLIMHKSNQTKTAIVLTEDWDFCLFQYQYHITMSYMFKFPVFTNSSKTTLS